MKHDQLPAKLTAMNTEGPQTFSMAESMPFLRQPPRTVPLSTRLVLFLGGPFAWLGWMFLTVGILFGSLFGTNVDWSSMFLFRGQLETAQGTVWSSEKTHFSEGGGRHSKGTPIYAHQYRFYFNDTEYSGTSYSVGGGSRNGQNVTIEFPAGRPGRSRIKRMRRAPFGIGAGVVLLFPIIGLAAVLNGLRRGRNNVRLLTNGELAEGRLISKERTNVRINNRTVYELTFTFKDSRGEVKQTVVKTNEPEKLEDDRLERVFYDPENPSRALLFDNLPGKQRFTSDGEIEACGFWRGAAVMFFPSMVVVILLVLLAIRFR
jgi:hypothetical protein